MLLSRGPVSADMERQLLVSILTQSSPNTSYLKGPNQNQFQARNKAEDTVSARSLALVLCIGGIIFLKNIMGPFLFTHRYYKNYHKIKINI